MIKELTSLRFILILVIFFHHALPSYPGGGDMGVAFFFVLSGFCYTLGYGRKVLSSDFSYGDFIKGRLVKFYPLHWITLLLAIPISLVGISCKDALILGGNFLLLQSWIPLPEVFFSYNAVSWFLCDMVFLVVCFPVVFRWLDSCAKRRVFLITVATAYCILCVITPERLRNAVLYINPIVRLCDFSIGLLAGMWYQRLSEKENVVYYVQRHKTLTAILALLSFLILISLSIFVPEEYSVMAWIFWPAIVIMLVSISLNPGGLLASPVLQKLGSVSFTFYMIHQLVIKYLTITCGKADIQLSLPLNVTIALILSILFTFLLDKYFLKPIAASLKRKIQ